jgi:hypothetical protein
MEKQGYNMKKFSIPALALALAACGNSDSNNLAKGTYQVASSALYNDEIVPNTKYLMKFSVDSLTNRIIMLEAMSIMSRSRCFEYRASQWDYSGVLNQDFESAEILDKTFNCIGHDSGLNVSYMVSKINETFEPNLDLFGDEMRGNAAILNDTRCLTKDGFYISGLTSSYDMSIDGCCKIVEVEDWSSSVAIKSWNNSLLTLAIGGAELKFENNATMTELAEEEVVQTV